MVFDSSLDAKEQVRQAIDIVELVGGYVQLRRQGRGYVGLVSLARRHAVPACKSIPSGSRSSAGSATSAATSSASS